MDPVSVKTYSVEEYSYVNQSQTADLSYINRNEVLRYAGIRASALSALGADPTAGSDDAPDTERLNALIDECVSEISPVITYKVCCRPVIIDWKCGMPTLPVDIRGSRDLTECLKGCGAAMLMAATIGIGADRLIAKYERISPSKALIMQALGAERVEALCDVFCSDISSSLSSAQKSLRPRFSPGYGDLPLEIQREFLAFLDCAHLAGITLNDSLLMSPSKSVTAIVGIAAAHDQDPAQLHETGIGLMKSGDRVQGRAKLEMACAMGYGRSALYLGDLSTKEGGLYGDIREAYIYYAIADKCGIKDARQRISAMTSRYGDKFYIDIDKWINDPLGAIEELKKKDKSK